MMSLDAAFDRLGSALRERGYVFEREERASEETGERLAIFRSPKVLVRVWWNGRARLLALQVEADGEWVEFARRSFGPSGLEETSVEALVHAVRNEVDETSTEPG